MNEQLAERFRRSLEQLLRRLRAAPEVSLVQLFGSVQRGQASEHSDIDLYVLTDRRQFWRSGEVVEGVEVEQVVCPVEVLRKRLATGDALALQAFATGETLLDRDRQGAELRGLAQRLYAQGPAPMRPGQVSSQRAVLTRVVQKLERLPPDSLEARFMAGDGVQRAVAAFHQYHRLWTRGPQHCVGDIRTKDARAAQLLVRYLQQGQGVEQAAAFIDAVVESLGGRLLAYESERTPC